MSTLASVHCPNTISDSSQEHPNKGLNLLGDLAMTLRDLDIELI
jgi:hypothetical protein